VAPRLDPIPSISHRCTSRLGHRRADALGSPFDAFPNLATGDLLRAAFDLLYPDLHLRIIGRGGEVGREQRERKYEQHEQAKAFMKFLMGRVI